MIPNGARRVWMVQTDPSVSQREPGSSPSQTVLLFDVFDPSFCLWGEFKQLVVNSTPILTGIVMFQLILDTLTVWIGSPYPSTSMV